MWLLLIERQEILNLLLHSLNILFDNQIFKVNFIDINLQNKMGKRDQN